MTTLLSSLSDEELQEISHNQTVSYAERDGAKIELSRREFGVPEDSLFNHERLHDALLYTHDMMDRASIKWVLIGPMAKLIHQTSLPVFEANGIQGVILRRYASASGISMLKDVVEEHDYDLEYFKFSHKGVPIEMHIIDDDFGVFSNPEQMGYFIEEFLLPNPIAKYKEQEDDILWSLK